MLKSMTGFARVEEMAGEKSFLIEIKSLNGKQFELNMKLTPLLKPYEIALRQIISEQLQRGSVECTIALKQNGGTSSITINQDVAKLYFTPLREMAEELNIKVSEYILAALLRLPDVVVPNTEVLSQNEYAAFENSFRSAIAKLDEHRKSEGLALEKDLKQRIENILSYQEKVDEITPLRQHRMKEELRRKIEEQVGKDRLDTNRFEQEMIYYIEKIDISEEQVRLKNHCEYFLSILKDLDSSKGKKLGFVLQEIGREINTTGSKAYDSDIQKLVVLMKDELEKAKEQVLNIL
jgi:uncharacterized protein (TIGR00255 family)